MKIYAIIIAASLIAGEIHSQEPLTDSLAMKLLQLEYSVQEEESACMKQNLILQKAKTLSVAGRYHESLLELQRIDPGSMLNTTELYYERALCFFLSGDHNQSYNEMLGIPDSTICNTLKYQRLWLLNLSEAGKFEECKNRLLERENLTENQKKKIDSLPVTFRFRSPLKASELSAFMPGSGQIYSGYTGKGIISILLHAGTGYIAVAGFMSGIYIVPTVFGVYPLLRFYIGGQIMSENLARRKNLENEEDLKTLYNEIIFLVCK